MSRLFLAVDGFDLEIGPSTSDVLDAELNALMMSASKEVNVVADFSKLGRRSVSRIGLLSGIHRLISRYPCSRRIHREPSQGKHQCDYGVVSLASRVKWYASILSGSNRAFRNRMFASACKPSSFANDAEVNSHQLG